MPPKGDWTSGFASSIDKSKIEDGEVKTFLPVYNSSTTYTYSAPSKTRRRHDPCSFPDFNADKAEEAYRGLKNAASASALRSTDEPYVGLKNVGSTCYLNSLLQYMFVNVAFRKCILATSTKDEIFRSLQCLFGFMQRGRLRVCDPSDFVTCSGITVGVQEDVTELWQLLINYLTNKTQGSIKSFVSFRQTSEVVCEACQRTSHREEQFCELRVYLGEHPVTEDVDKTEALDLRAAICTCFTTEKLSGTNQYDCRECGLQNAQRKNALISLPPFLHIVLDRFQWDAVSCERKKICSPIRYPELLDLSEFITSPQAPEGEAMPAKFELIAVLEHHSKRADSGHYTATLRQPTCGASDSHAAGSWWQFNDSNVSRITSPGVEAESDEASGFCRAWSSKTAYMLAYRRLNSCSEEKLCSDGSTIPLPSWVDEAINNSNPTEDLDRLSRFRTCLHRRVDEDASIREHLCEANGSHASQLSVVPERWLQEWCQGVESEIPGEGPVRVDYSQIILPSSAARSSSEDLEEIKAHRLNPFALWDGRAKLVPTELFTGRLLKSSEREVRLIPHGLKLNDVSFESWADPKVATALQGLLRCTREIVEIVVRLRDIKQSDETPSVLVRSAHLSQILRNVLKAEDVPTPSNRRRKPPALPSWSVWDALKSEFIRYQKCPVVSTVGGIAQFSSASRKQTSVQKIVDLGEGLRCPHGQLVSRFNHVSAPPSDVSRLLELFRTRCDHWAELGVYAPPVSGSNLLPAGTPVCQMCFEDNKENAKEKRKMKATRDKFPTLCSGEIPLGNHSYGDARFMPEGKYCLIPASWREHWMQYLRDSSLSVPPVNPDSLRCQHGRLKYDPARYFQQCQSGLDDLRHPHHDAYILVPMTEGQAIFDAFPPLENGGSPSWCVLDAKTIVIDGGQKVRTFDTNPPVCQSCVQIGKRNLEVELVDQRESTVGSRSKQELIVDMDASGKEVKRRIIKDFSLQGVAPGQLLMSTGSDQVSLGDMDSLEQVLGPRARGQWLLCRLRVPITAELFAEDLGGSAEADVICITPTAKRQKTGSESALARSRLAQSTTAAT